MLLKWHMASKINGRGCQPEGARKGTGEERPGSTGQDAG